MKALINFLKSLANAIPNQCAKNAANNVEKCGSVPKAGDISNIIRDVNVSDRNITTVFYTKGTGGSSNTARLGNYDSSAARNCPDSVFADMAADLEYDKALARESQKLFSQSIKDWAKAAGAVAAGYAASLLAGCNPGGREQELYDAFDAAQLEGDIDPVESMQRAMRQAQRNQQNGRGGCGCTYSVVEAGAGVNYGNSCEPPDKFRPPGYSYPGYMELRKNCPGQNNPSTTSSLNFEIFLDTL
jgi:hypothetical protein